MATPAILGLIAVAIAAWAIYWAPPRNRKRSYAVTTLIQRDRAAVFAVMADFSTFTSLLTGAQSVEALTAGPVAVGSRYGARIVVGSVQFVDVDEVLIFDPPRELAWRATGYVSRTETVTLDDDGRGTVVNHRFESVESLVNSLLGLSLFGGLFNRAGIRERREAWDRIKRGMEAGRTA